MQSSSVHKNVPTLKMINSHFPNFLSIDKVLHKWGYSKKGAKIRYTMGAIKKK